MCNTSKTGGCGSLTRLEGPGRWLSGAPPPQPAGWSSWFHSTWPPLSGPGCFPPSRCFPLSSPRPGPPEWPGRTGSPPRNWSELEQQKAGMSKINRMGGYPSRVSARGGEATSQTCCGGVERNRTALGACLRLSEALAEICGIAFPGWTQN